MKSEKGRLKFIFIKLNIFSAVIFHFYSLKKAEYFLKKGRLKLKLERPVRLTLKLGKGRLKLKLEKGRLQLKLEKAG